MFRINKHITTLLLIFALLCGGVGYAQTWQGDGSEGNPWQIRTAEDLHALALFVNESRANANSTRGQHWQMMDNIDLTDFLSGNPQGWLPIGRALDIKGNRRHSFQGHFHGDRRTISGLRINRHCDDEHHPENFFIGLFGIIEHATIENLAVVVAENDSVRGDNFTGILVGSAHWNNRIEQVSTEGKVSGQLFVGGLAGKLANSHIANCYSKANVYGTSRHIGGLVGTMYFGGSITHSYASGNVDGYVSVGGLVGYIRFENAIIRNAFAANHSVITRQDEGGQQTAGRLVGHEFESTTNFSNNFVNSGLVLRGRFGYNDGCNDTILEAFSDVNFFISPDHWYGNAWDFERVWGFDYYSVLPIFRWQIVPEPFLDTLFITDGAIIYPAFSPYVFEYNVFLPCGNGNFMYFDFISDDRLSLHLGNLAEYGELRFDYFGRNEGAISYLYVTVVNALNRYQIYRFVLHTPFDSIRIIKPYPNVLTVVNRPDIHGWGQFFLETGYQWFRDGQPLEGQNRGVLYLGRNETVGNSRFSVKVTYLDGTVNRVCPRSWSVEVANLQVFPNPTYGHLTVQSATSETPSRIEVFTICGRLVKVVNPTGNQTELNLSGLQPGTYIVRQNGQTAVVIKQ